MWVGGRCFFWSSSHDWQKLFTTNALVLLTLGVFLHLKYKQNQVRLVFLLHANILFIFASSLISMGHQNMFKIVFRLIEIIWKMINESHGSVLLSGWQAVFPQRPVVTTGVAGLCRAGDKGRVAGQRWQVASCHHSWRDGCCDILGLNNLRCNNTSPLATAKCGSWLHVSLMPSPPNPLHNSAGTGEAAMCRRTAHWHQGRREGDRGRMQWRWKMGR